MVERKPRRRTRRGSGDADRTGGATAADQPATGETGAPPDTSPPAFGTTAAEKEKAFTPDVLESTVIAIPLLEDFKKTGGLKELYNVIIDVNLEYSGGRDLARQHVRRLIAAILKDDGVKAGSAYPSQGIFGSKTDLSEQYIFARLRGELIQELVRRDRSEAEKAGRASGRSQAIYHVWPDFPIERLTMKSVSTVKADAARNAFAALGKDIVWAVADSGIDASQPHFRLHRNLELDAALMHRDFTGIDDLQVEDVSQGAEALEAAQARAGESALKACHDEHGHGTHVAGIIAGALQCVQREGQEEKHYRIIGTTNQRDENDTVMRVEEEYPEASGMAPCCKLLSLKVLDAKGRGSASNLIAALEYVQKLNGNGRRLLVHGVNLSVGYDFEPKWFACGQSPLCVEVDRLVRAGVVVVVAAGNTGYGWNQTAFRGAVAAGMDLTINDPGNAELAITVGSTHRDMPHVYGVSYFSSKGPTGDGRRKPDLVAPGEKIISCASSKLPYAAPTNAPAAAGLGAPAMPEVRAAALGDSPLAVAEPPAPAADAAVLPAEPQVAPAKPAAAVIEARYREDSGTSMAAPHVSGVIAAFLSVRREFIGRPDRVKQIFLDTATDLNRTPTFQGQGLVDLMRAIQSV